MDKTSNAGGNVHLVNSKSEVVGEKFWLMDRFIHKSNNHEIRMVLVGQIMDDLQNLSSSPVKHFCNTVTP